MINRDNRPQISVHYRKTIQFLWFCLIWLILAEKGQKSSGAYR